MKTKTNNLLASLGEPQWTNHMEKFHGLTPWALTSIEAPPYTGWWRVHTGKGSYSRRWWNGMRWSEIVGTWMSDGDVLLQQLQELPKEKSDKVIWCGLAREHIAGYTYLMLKSPKLVRNEQAEA